MGPTPRNNRFGEWSAQGKATPPSRCTVASLATDTSSLPRGIFNRRPGVPPNTPATPSASARRIHFSNLSPSRRAQQPLTPSDLRQSTSGSRIKVNMWLEAQRPAYHSSNPLGTVSSPLTRPSTRSATVQSRGGVHTTYHSSPRVISGGNTPPLASSPSDSHLGSPCFPLHHTPELGDMEWTTRRDNPFAYLAEYTSDFTSSPPDSRGDALTSFSAVEGQGTQQRGETQGFPWGIASPTSPRPLAKRLPTKFGKPLPVGFPDTPEGKS